MNVECLKEILVAYKLNHDVQPDRSIVVNYRGYKIYLRPKNKPHHVSGLKLEVRNIAYVANKNSNDVLQDINQINENHDCKVWVDRYGLVSICGQVSYSSDSALMANLPNDITDAISAISEFRQKLGLM